MKTFWKKNESRANLRTKHKNLVFKGLAFEDYLTLFLESKKEAISQINKIESIGKHDFKNLESLLIINNLKRNLLNTKTEKLSY